MTLLGALGSLFFKKASEKNVGLISLLKNRWLYFGGILYLASLLITVYLLRVLDYSVVLPLTSVTYVWTLFIAYLILKEKISIKQIIGVVLIVCGSIFIAF